MTPTKIINTRWSTLLFGLTFVAIFFSLVTVVTLSSGKTLLIVNGYTFKEEYSVAKERRIHTRWCCSEPTNSKCDVYIHVNDRFEVIFTANAHNHEPIFCQMFQNRMM